jgi:hypothetical protein
MKLKFTKKAIYRLEKEKDVKMGDLQKMGDPSEFRFSLIIDLIWAGRLYDNPALTVDQVMEDIDFANIDEYSEAIAEAAEQAFGDIAPPEDEDAPKEVGNETGG